MRTTIGIALSLQLIAAPAVAENYICVADQAVGFGFNKATKQWEITKFSVADEKYTMTTEGGERMWKKFGDPLRLPCTENPGTISCNIGPWQYVILDKTTLRYQDVYTFGYVGGQDSPHNTPYIQIGRCSSM